MKKPATYIGGFKPQVSSTKGDCVCTVVRSRSEKALALRAQFSGQSQCRTTSWSEEGHEERVSGNGKDYMYPRKKNRDGALCNERRRERRQGKV